MDARKQTSVSHSFTESEILSLDAGLRMDGLWGIVIEVLRTTKDNILVTLAQGNLSMFNPTRQVVIPEPRPNVSINRKQGVD